MLFAIVASATDPAYILEKRGKKIVQRHEIVSQVWRNILLHQKFCGGHSSYSVSSGILLNQCSSDFVPINNQLFALVVSRSIIKISHTSFVL